MGQELVRRTSATLEDRLSLTRMAIESGDVSWQNESSHITKEIQRIIQKKRVFCACI